LLIKHIFVPLLPSSPNVLWTDLVQAAAPGTLARHRETLQNMGLHNTGIKKTVTSNQAMVECDADLIP